MSQEDQVGKAKFWNSLLSATHIKLRNECLWKEHSPEYSVVSDFQCLPVLIWIEVGLHQERIKQASYQANFPNSRFAPYIIVVSYRWQYATKCCSWWIAACCSFGKIQFLLSSFRHRLWFSVQPLKRYRSPLHLPIIGAGVHEASRYNCMGSRSSGNKENQGINIEILTTALHCRYQKSKRNRIMISNHCKVLNSTIKHCVRNSLNVATEQKSPNSASAKECIVLTAGAEAAHKNE